MCSSARSCILSRTHPAAYLLCSSLLYQLLHQPLLLLLARR
jgi:hypothetical protein